MNLIFQIPYKKFSFMRFGGTSLTGLKTGGPFCSHGHECPRYIRLSLTGRFLKLHDDSFQPGGEQAIVTLPGMIAPGHIFLVKTKGMNILKAVS